MLRGVLASVWKTQKRGFDAGGWKKWNSVPLGRYLYFVGIRKKCE
jgi:hypothetical protein